MTTVEALPDLYGILGVPRYTDCDGIRRAYIRRAREYHPDLHPGDTNAAEKMSAVNAAYETLTDSARRAEYDARRGTIRVQPGASQPSYRHATPRSSRTHASSKEPGPLHTAMLIFARLYRLVAA